MIQTLIQNILGNVRTDWHTGRAQPRGRIPIKEIFLEATSMAKGLMYGQMVIALKDSGEVPN